MGLTDREIIKGVLTKHAYFILLHQHVFLLCVQCSEIFKEKIKAEERGWEKNKTNYKSCQLHLWGKIYKNPCHCNGSILEYLF